VSGAIILHATPFREVPRERVGMGDALSSAEDGLDQLAPLQHLIDSARGVEGVDPDAVHSADAAMVALTADLNAVKTAGPTDVFAAPSKFDTGSFLAGLGLALVGTALVYLVTENTSQPQRRPSRRRRTA
jgi:hypothetical protein